MREHIEFFKISSAVVKIVAWIFLFLGFLAGLSIMLGFVPGSPRVFGLGVWALYGFFFFLFILITKIADVVVTLIEHVEK
jgi:hypothetical protein